AGDLRACARARRHRARAGSRGAADALARARVLPDDRSGRRRPPPHDRLPPPPHPPPHQLPADPPLVPAAGAVPRPRPPRPATPAAPVAVRIDTSAGGDAQATRASLSQQVVAAADVVEAPATDALATARAPWLLVVPAGDRLSPLALQRFGQAATLAPDAAL